MAGRAKVLLQVIVGARQILDLVAPEESVPITLGDFAEVCHRWSELTQLVLLLRHGCQQVLILLLEGGCVVLGGVGKEVSGLMQPRIGLPDG
jgi:hypothetical protein